MTDPLFFSTPHMSPSQLGEVTGLSPDMQRDWRRRGYIGKIGTMQGNGRWLYDWADAFYLCIMRQLYDCGVELPLAMRASVTCSTFVYFHITHERILKSASPKPRYLRLFRDEAADNEVNGGWAAKPMHSLDDEALAASIIIDTLVIARELPSEFNEPMRRAHMLILEDIAKKKGK